MQAQKLITNKKGINIMQKIIIVMLMLVACGATLKSQYIMPCGGEDGYDWRVGTTQAISWSKYFMDTTGKIDILLWNASDATFTTIATDIPVVNEYYLWSIPMGQVLGNHFKIKIVYNGGFLPKFKYVSNDFFSIKGPLPPGDHLTLPSSKVTKSNDNHFTLYPNPASSIISIESNNKFFGLEIYDSKGLLVVHKKFNYRNSYQLDPILNRLASGTYMVLVRFMGDSSTEQLVIAN